MTRTLTPTDKGLGLIFDPAILDQLEIDSGTLLEVTIEGNGILIRPIETEHRARVLEVAEEVMTIHEETLRKLAL